MQIDGRCIEIFLVNMVFDFVFDIDPRKHMSMHFYLGLC